MSGSTLRRGRGSTNGKRAEELRPDLPCIAFYDVSDHRIYLEFWSFANSIKWLLVLDLLWIVVVYDGFII